MKANIARSTETSAAPVEERFDALVSSIGDVFYITDLTTWQLEYLSPSYETVWGRPVAALLEDLSRFFDALHPDDRDSFLEGRAAQERGEPVTKEYRILRPNGEERWIHDRSFPVPGRERTRAAGVASDITERKTAEARREALVRLADRWRDLEDPGEIAFASSEVLGQALQASRVGYGTVDRDAETLHIEKDWTAPGVAALAGRLDLRDYGSFIDVLTRGELIAVRDARTDNRTAQATAALKARGTRSLVAVPVTERAQLVAVFFVSSAAARDWSAEDLAFIQEVAGRTRTAVERARSAAALRATNARLSLLAAAAERLASARSLDELTSETAKAARGLAQADAVSLVLRDGDDCCHVAEDGVAPLWKGQRFPLASCLSGVAMLRRRTVVVPDLEADDLVPQGLYRPTFVRSAVLVPLGQAEPTAAIGVYWAHAHVPAEQEIAGLEALARTAGAVLTRLQAEAQVRALNEDLEAKVAERTAERDRVWRLSRDLLVVVGTDGLFRAVNPAWTAILGHAPEEVVGRSFRDFIWPEDAERTQAGLDAAAASHDLTSFENRYRHKDGTPRWISWHTSVEGDRVYAYGRDVTAEKARQAELEAAQEQLRHAQKMEAMGSLTGGVAHDFNNLLTPILGGLDRLQRRELGTERDQRLIEGALQSAERARSLVQRLLAFARRQPLQPRAINVGDLVRGMVDLIGSTTGPQINVAIEIEPDLPAALADANQLEMALLNLAVNARDAMPEGGKLQIAATSETVGPKPQSGVAPGRYVRLSVADTGVGMDRATLARAVEPFFSTKGVGQGTGLGLSMVHGLAAQLGGALVIRSNPGVGTNVELWLPVADPEMTAQPSATPEDKPAASASGVVLLVDDEDLVRATAADMLVELGYEVVEAGSAEEARRLVADGLMPDLLITDHLMPGMSGTDLIQTLWAQRPGLPALIMSGYADVEGIAPDLPRLIKPFRRSDLSASLARLTSGPSGLPGG